MNRDDFDRMRARENDDILAKLRGPDRAVARRQQIIRAAVWLAGIVALLVIVAVIVS